MANFISYRNGHPVISTAPDPVAVPNMGQAQQQVAQQGAPINLMASNMNQQQAMTPAGQLLAQAQQLMNDPSIPMDQKMFQLQQIMDSLDAEEQRLKGLR